MLLSELCQPVNLCDVQVNLNVVREVAYSDENLVQADVFLLGYLESRNSYDKISAEGVQIIRKQLYALHETSKPLKIIDLGDCKQGETVAESYKNLQAVVEQVALYGKPLVIFGGTQETVCYVAQASFRQVAYPAVCFVDAKFDWSVQTDFCNTNYFTKLTEEHPNVRILNVANQEYLSEKKAFEWFAKNHYYSIRLGDCNAEIQQTEPLIRDAQLVSFDMNVVRFSDNPAGRNVNGLYSELACQCAWYAGYSSRMNTFFLQEYDSKKDSDEISAQLAAQILWHTLDGISQRKNETGDFSDETYIRRYLKHPLFPKDICFYESIASQAIWAEVPVGASGKKRVIPCSRTDYDKFLSGEIPQFWLTEHSRLLALYEK